MWTSNIFAAVALASLALPAFAQPGALDPSFGQTGTATMPLGGYATISVKIRQQPDDAILIAAATARTATDPASVPPGTIQLVRLLANGTPDTTFGSQGIASLSVRDMFIAPVDMQLQPDGKIVVADYIVEVGQYRPPHHGAVTRFNADGSLDTSFGKAGTVLLTALGGGPQDAPSVLLLQTDGKILVADSSSEFGQTVLRLNTDGAPDKGFGVGGIAQISLNGGATEALALQSDGKIVAISTVAACLLPNGTLDPRDAPGTVIASTAAQALTGGPALAVQQNDLYIEAGAAGSLLQDIQLQRFTIGNRRDKSFHDPAFHFATNAKKQNVSQDYAMAMQQDGSIVVTGRYLVSPDQKFGLARVLANGKLDSTFGAHGVLTTSFSGNNARASAVALQADGNIIVAGTAASANEATSALAVARYLGN